MWPVWLCALAVTGLLIAERRRWRLARWATKMLAASCYIWAALGAGACSSGYGRRLLLGLACAWLGDLLLLSEGRSRWFRTGIVAFLLTHVAYTAAFLTFPVRTGGVAIAASAVGLVVAVVLRWLDPSLPLEFRWPVRVYVAAIAVMLVVSFAAVGAGAPPALGLGTLAFAASDLAVARGRFLAAGFANLAWGLLLYFAAQLLLAFTVP